MILTVTCGNGHNAAARAMKERLQAEGGYDVMLLDVLKEWSNPLNNWFVDNGYPICCGSPVLLPIYSSYLEHYRKVSPDTRYSSISKDVPLSIVQKLYRKIADYRPDVIYCTHFYASMALTFLRLAYRVPAKIIGLTLDYVVVPFYESCIGVDYLAIPNDDFRSAYRAKGFTNEQLVSTGIPINVRFTVPYDKKTMRKKLHISSETFTILVMFGGGEWYGGYRILKQVLRCVHKRKTRIIMINGHDRKSYELTEKLKGSLPPNIKILNVGFTDCVEQYMAAADVAVSKAGGLSTTEMVHAGLPLVCTMQLPAQEKYNLAYMEDRGCARHYETTKELEEILSEMMDNPEVAEKMRQATVSLRGNGAENIFRLIDAQPRAFYDDSYFRLVDFDSVKKNVEVALAAETRKFKAVKAKAVKRSESKTKSEDF